MRIGYVKFLLLAICGAASSLLAEETFVAVDPVEYIQMDNGLSDYNSDLQKLRDLRVILRSGEAISEYFHTVSWVYGKSGFRALAAALERAGPIVKRLSDPKSRRVTRKEAAATIRHLGIALRDTPRFLPKFTKNYPYENVSFTRAIYPNYTGLAFKFLIDLQRALINATKRHLVTAHLPAPAKKLWLRVSPDGSSVRANGPVFQNATVSTSSGTYSYSSATYTTSVSSGLISNSADTLQLEGSGVIGTWWLQSNPSDILSAGRWLAFPPGIDIPADASELPPIVLNVATFLNDTEYPAGTRLVKVSEGFAAPEGAVPLAVPVQISRLVQSGSWDIQGSVETFSDSDPSHSFSLTPAR